MQQYRSQRIAQALGRRFGQDGDEGADMANVAITGTKLQPACGWKDRK